MKKTKTGSKKASSNVAENKGKPVELESLTEDAIEGLTPEQQDYVTKQLLRQTPEYNAMWELELWKKNQKRAFQQFMKQKEKDFLENFEKQSKKRLDKEREALHQEKEKLAAHNEKLERSIIEMESRDKKIKHLERELHRQKETLTKDHERKSEDMRHAIKLAKEECVHKVDLERKRVRALQDENQSNANRLRVLTEKYDNLLNEYHDLKKSHVESDVSKVQAEVDRLKKNLDEANLSKKRYKNQARKLKRENETQARKHQSTINELNHQHNRMLFDIKREFTKMTVMGNHYRPPMPEVFPTGFSNSASAPPNTHQPTTTEQPKPASIEEEIKKLIDIEKQKLAAQQPQSPVEEKPQKKLEPLANEYIETSENNSSDVSDLNKTPLSEKSINVPSTKKRKPLSSRKSQKAEKPRMSAKKKALSPDEELRRLIRDKAKILQSGVYDENSPVVREIQKKIDLLASSS